MRHYIFRDTVAAKNDVSIKDIGFLPTSMVIITQEPKQSQWLQRKGQWSNKEVGLFNPNDVDIEAEVRFYGD